MAKKYQTLSEFIKAPFHSTTNITQDQVKLGQDYKETKKDVVFEAYTVIENAYYFHLKVPSKSKKDQELYYDVVLRFFPDDKSDLTSNNLDTYRIQFFSNSPGFIYRYAVLYKMNGYLIEELYSKLDKRYSHQLPINTNSDFKMYYDRTIYIGCRYLLEKKFKLLIPKALPISKKKSSRSFFSDIKDVSTMQLEMDLRNLEKKNMKTLDRILEEDRITKNYKKRKENDSHRIKAKMKVGRNVRSIKKLVKKTGKSKITGSKSVGK
jgi:hypothetical protein